MLRFTLSSRSEARDLLPTPFQLLLSLLLSLSLPFASVYVVIPLALTKEGTEARPPLPRRRGRTRGAAPGAPAASPLFPFLFWGPGGGALAPPPPPPLKILHHQKLFV